MSLYWSEWRRWMCNNDEQSKSEFFCRFRFRWVSFWGKNFAHANTNETKKKLKFFDNGLSMMNQDKNGMSTENSSFELKWAFSSRFLSSCVVRSSHKQGNLHSFTNQSSLKKNTNDETQLVVLNRLWCYSIKMTVQCACLKISDIFTLFRHQYARKSSTANEKKSSNFGFKLICSFGNYPFHSSIYSLTLLHATHPYSTLIIAPYTQVSVIHFPFLMSFLHYFLKKGNQNRFLNF